VVLLKEKKPAKPKREGKTIGIRFSQKQVEALEKISARDYRTVSGLVKVAITEYCKARNISDWPEA
jgi:predicted DNA-binding protein